MNVNPVSFQGLWVLNRTNQHSNKSCEVAHYEYRPFSDESKAEAKSQVEKYDGKMVESYYNDSQSPYKTTLLNVKMGALLNISSVDYANAKVAAPDDFDRSGNHEKILIG